MQIINFPFDQISSFSKTDVAYQLADPRLVPFYKYVPNIESLKQVIQDKKGAKNNRTILAETLKNQYEKAAIEAPENVEKLSDTNTFTITTAHQPSLFTGPLYVILKIASTINLARALNKQVDQHIVPVFIIGGEDHDFEEINHLHLFGNQVKWKTNQSGSVGRMSLDGILEAKNELTNILGSSPNAAQLVEMMELALNNASSYGEFAFIFLHQIFQTTELVILRMDHPQLKKEFKSIIKEEIFKQSSFDLVTPTQKKIEQAGFSPQAFVREINFFYLSEGRRDRIELQGDRFKIIDTEKSFSKEEMELEIENHPERFSPNVITRPLFQELILPNLAYIGGGGEIAYWLERKNQFEHYDINFPMLIRRNSILWIDKSSAKQWAQLEMDIPDLFKDEESNVTQWVKDHTASELSIHEELSMITKAFEDIEKKASEIDPTLVNTIAAEKTKVLKSTEQLAGRLIRSQKQKYEVNINKLRKVQHKLFPNGGLQERHENFMNMYLRNGDDMISYLIEHLNPLETDFKVIIEGEKES